MQLIRILVLITAGVFSQAAYAQMLGMKSFKLQEDNLDFKINTLYKNADGLIYAGTTIGLLCWEN